MDKQLKIAVSAGHYPKNPGARYSCYSEYSECSAIVGLIINLLTLNGHLVYHVPSVGLVKKVDAINELRPDAAMEIHLNAGGGSGCETLICPDSIEGLQLAEMVQKEIVGSIQDLKDRGVKNGWWHNPLPLNIFKPQNAVIDYFLLKTKCPAIIVEPFFIDGDYKFLGSWGMYRQIALGVCHGVLMWGKNNNKEKTP